MKPRLLALLRCPDCRSDLDLRDPTTEPAQWTGAAVPTRCTGACGSSPSDAGADNCPACARLEVTEGKLACRGCGATYAVSGGVPRLRVSATPDATRPRTARSFGYLWAKSTPGGEAYDVTSYHYTKMEQSLSLDSPRGLVLDGGCGDGIDLAQQAERDGVEAVGVELSDGGCRSSHLRTQHLARGHVVQADLCQLPFADGTFDLAYSYGVLHHLGVPERGLREVVRVAGPGARVVAYLYEDFSERSRFLRWSLAAANATRAVTTRLPPRLLYALCWLGAPVIFTLFTLPAIVGRRIPGLARLAAGVPFRHGTGPFSLVGDLYDRFSAPVEWRYGRKGSFALFADAGLQDVRVAPERGWMVTGTKPGARQEKAGSHGCV